MLIVHHFGHLDFYLSYNQMDSQKTLYTHLWTPEDHSYRIYQIPDSFYSSTMRFIFAVISLL